jgi:hypothetical protein
MTRIQDSPFIAVVALGLACFSTGFTLTASAYGARKGASEDTSATEQKSTGRAPSERSCVPSSTRPER